MFYECDSGARPTDGDCFLYTLVVYVKTGPVPEAAVRIRVSTLRENNNFSYQLRYV